jgi:hypothetical protein
MDERGRLGMKRCAEKNTTYQTGLFTTTEPEWVEVDVKRVRMERSRKFGGPWLGRELLRRLELDRFLGREATERTRGDSLVGDGHDFDPRSAV